VSFDYVIGYSYLKLSPLVALLVDQEALGYCLEKTMLEVFHKILEIYLISEVEAPRIETITVNSRGEGKGSKSAS
jgi:hypothetical protein